MAIICPSITLKLEEYNDYFSKVSKLSKRIHLDIMDGTLTETKSIQLNEITIPSGYQIDIHLMVARPMDYIDQLVKLKPHLVIIHNEADVHHMYFAALLHQHDILTGLAVLEDTPIDYTFQIIHSFDHVLIFSGHLGYYGGETNLSLLNKVTQTLDYHPGVEIGWDGGINDHNIKSLVDGGVEVLNIGSYLHNSEDIDQAYAKLEGLI